jgi:Flp pilus assembly protein TadG
VELAILGPLVIALTFGIVQAGLTSYAHSLAAAAAREGVTAARAYRADTTAGTDRAERFLRLHAHDSLLDPTVTATTTATGVRVDVTGTALTVLPGIPVPTIHAMAQAERERVTTQATP